jgi:hypothetical protein
MDSVQNIETLGQRIVDIAWLAVGVHLKLAGESNQNSADAMVEAKLQQRAQVGGADRMSQVTDDQAVAGDRLGGS